MEIKQQYWQNYLHDVAIDQLTADYQTEGYEVSKKDKIGNYQPDLVARKGDEVIILEVKTEKLTADKRRQIAELGDYVRNHKNHKFLIVLANPPKRKKIAIPNIESLLSGYFNKNIPSDLQKLRAHTVDITSVSSVNLNEVTVMETGDIVVNGTALIDVEIRYSDSLDGRVNDNNIAHIEVFPCSFDAVLMYTPDKHLLVSEMNELTVDTSDYSE